MNRALFALATLIPAFAWAAPADLIRGLPPGGTWNQEVRKVVGALYDTNGNGLLDTDAEIDAVDCGIWKARPVRICAELSVDPSSTNRTSTLRLGKALGTKAPSSPTRWGSDSASFRKGMMIVRSKSALVISRAPGA